MCGGVATGHKEGREGRMDGWMEGGARYKDEHGGEEEMDR